MSLPPPSRRRSASRAAFVASPRRSMSAISSGHHSATSHTLPGASAKKSYPPTPSTPLASVVLVSTPGVVVLGNIRRGASGTP
eukprot:4956266-Pleurochrysis_carterae.AAC.1